MSPVLHQLLLPSSAAHVAAPPHPTGTWRGQRTSRVVQRSAHPREAELRPVPSSLQSSNSERPPTSNSPQVSVDPSSISRDLGRPHTRMCGCPRRCGGRTAVPPSARRLRAAVPSGNCVLSTATRRVRLSVPGPAAAWSRRTTLPFHCIEESATARPQALHRQVGRRRTPTPPHH